MKECSFKSDVNMAYFSVCIFFSSRFKWHKFQDDSYLHDGHLAKPAIFSVIAANKLSYWIIAPYARKTSSEQLLLKTHDSVVNLIGLFTAQRHPAGFNQQNNSFHWKKIYQFFTTHCSFLQHG